MSSLAMVGSVPCHLNPQRSEEYFSPPRPSTGFSEDEAKARCQVIVMELPSPAPGATAGMTTVWVWGPVPAGAATDQNAPWQF